MKSERYNNVGSGAARCVLECVGKQYDARVAYGQLALRADLVRVHEKLLVELDVPFLEACVCPRGWSLDLTEHACCELRRFDDAVARVGAGKRPRRWRSFGAPVEDRQARRRRRIGLAWKMLGFKAMPWPGYCCPLGTS